MGLFGRIFGQARHRRWGYPGNQDRNHPLQGPLDCDQPGQERANATRTSAGRLPVSIPPSHVLGLAAACACGLMMTLFGPMISYLPRDRSPIFVLAPRHCLPPIKCSRGPRPSQARPGREVPRLPECLGWRCQYCCRCRNQRSDAWVLSSAGGPLHSLLLGGGSFATSQGCNGGRSPARDPTAACGATPPDTKRHPNGPETHSAPDRARPK